MTFEFVKRNKSNAIYPMFPKASYNAEQEVKNICLEITMKI